MGSLRKSGTEPKIRLYAEAPVKDRLLTIVDRIEYKLESIVRRYNARIVEKTIG